MKKTLSSLILVLIIMISASISVFANAIWPGDNRTVDPTKYANAELTYGFIESCVKQGVLRKLVTPNQQNSGEVFSSKNDALLITSSFVDTDGERACKNTTERIATALYGGKTKFLENFYIQDPGTNNWIAKPSKFCDPAQPDTNPENSQTCTLTMSRIVTELQKRADAQGLYVLAVGGQKPNLGPNYIWGVLNPLFGRCFKSTDVANNTPDVTIEGKQYSYEIDKETKSKVGYIITNSGEITCKDLGSLLQSDQYSYATLTTEEIQAQIDGQDKQDKISAISSVLSSSASKLDKCIGFSEQLKLVPASQTVRVMAEWLAEAGSDSHIYLTAGARGGGFLESTAGERDARSSRVFTDEQEDTVRECLGQEFGAELLEAIAAAGGSAPTTTAPDGDEGAGASDDCLSTNEFMAWIACPIINIADSFFETIEDQIQDTLKFNLEQQNEGDSLRSAWNIFRSLATTIIILGFLLALLVKAVRGE